MVSSNATGDTPKVPDASCKQRACCSSPSAMRYWCTVSLAAGGLLSLVGMIWRLLHATSAATILLAAAIGCVANWIKNRTLHCSITAWIFLAAAVLFLLGNAGLFTSNRTWFGHLWRSEPRSRSFLSGGLGASLHGRNIGISMNFSEKSSPTAAILAALSRLACCIRCDSLAR